MERKVVTLYHQGEYPNRTHGIQDDFEREDLDGDYVDDPVGTVLWDHMWGPVDDDLDDELDELMVEENLL